MSGRVSIRKHAYSHVPAPSPRSSPPRVSCVQTAVRHSSLLRFAQNAESLDDAASPDVEPTQLPKPSELPKPHVLTYRQRSQTYPWVESEADEELPSEIDPYQYPVAQLATLAIGQPRTPYILPKARDSTPLRAETREFTPLALPSPVELTRSQASSHLEYQAEIPRITPTLITRGPPPTPPRRSSLANQPRSSSGHLYSARSPSVSLPDPLPATPSPVPMRASNHAEPLSYPRYGGASRLPVYNDRLPPTRQPQTPADLTRRPLLTDRDAVYTEPPGSVGRRRIVNNDTSPTTRGRELRARSTREHHRAHLVEREQAGRVGPRLWLDEWTADRVGEENA